MTRICTDPLAPWPVGAMRGILDRDPIAEDGDTLPLGWHWLYFKEAVRASEIGPDGHAARGGFLPPIELPRRMWAGGRLTSHQPLRIGAPAELRSAVTEVKEKEGRSGSLVFVTVSHEVHQDGLAVEEEQILVFRAEGHYGDSASGSSDGGPGEPADWSETFTPNSVTLFQFSALTYNAHRIHYDRPHATGKEGYPGLLVHAPLTALLLMDAAGRHGTSLKSFRYRALSPLFVDGPIELVGLGQTGIVEAIGPSGSVAMRGWTL